MRTTTQPPKYEQGSCVFCNSQPERSCTVWAGKLVEGRGLGEGLAVDQIFFEKPTGR